MTIPRELLVASPIAGLALVISPSAFIWAHSDANASSGAFRPWELHPALVHFPIAFLLGAVGLDLFAWWSERPRAARAATRLMFAGVAFGVLAAAAGALAYFTVPAHTVAAHGIMLWHLGINLAAVALFAAVAMARGRLGLPGFGARLGGLVAACLLVIGSYLGGVLVYQGGAGVDPGILAPELRQGHQHSPGAAVAPETEHHATPPAPAATGSAGEASPSQHDHPPTSPDSKKPHADAAHQHGKSAPSKAPVDAAKGSAPHHATPPAPAATGSTGEASPSQHDHPPTSPDGKKPHADAAHQHGKPAASNAPQDGARQSAPEELPRIPKPDVGAAMAPPGYRVEVARSDLTYPTSVEFDDDGRMYVAEGGYIYGDDVAPARILRINAKGEAETVAEHLNGPITDLLWHGKRLYISHRGKISVLESEGVRDLVTGLPSQGDHHNNQMAIGPDGKLYFGQGVATNSGVVGLDSFRMGWLAKHPEVCDVPAKDIRVSDQAFETPDPLALFAEKTNAKKDGQDKGQVGSGAHAGHGAQAKDKGKEPTKPAPKGDDKGKAPAQPQGHEQHGGKGGDSEKQKASAQQPKQKQPDEGKHEGHAGEAGKPKSDAGSQAKPPEQGQHAAHGGDGKAPDQGFSLRKTFAFQPFGKTPPDAGALRGTTKASGTILRMNLDGSNLEVFAWGLRNPFGVAWGPNGKLYVSDNGYDERGSRPIAHAPDVLWEIKQGAWYGFPDYAAGVPVTDARFRPEQGPAPKFLMRDHPPVEKPLAELKNHVGAAKLDFSRSEKFGFKGQLFLALVGDMNPITGKHEERSGFEVIRIDPETGEAKTFFKAKDAALGPKGMEHVATAGPRRPVAVRFSPDGNTLYVVDVGAMAVISTAAGPAPRPFPRSGVVWRITREENAGR